MNGHLHLVQNIYHDEWIPMIYLYTNKTTYRQGQKKCEVKVTSNYHGVSLYCNPMVKMQQETKDETIL